MTGELQVLDLVVNGPLKAHIRTNRANRLYNNFRDYKADRVRDSKLPVGQRKNLPFNPPKPTMLEGIQDLILLFKEQFIEEKFKDCVNRTFIKTGTLPIMKDDCDEPATFVTYKKEQLCGTLSAVPEGTMDMCEEDEETDVNDIEYLERAVLSHYATYDDVCEDDSDSDDDDGN